MERTIGVFVYGTLGFSEVLSALLGREAVGSPAVVDGYRRVRVRDNLYPGLVAGSGTVEGRFHPVSPEEVAILDAFEDDFYDRIEIPVQPLDGGDPTAASVYVIPPRNGSFATAETWDRDGFARDHLTRYLAMVREYRQNYLAGLAGSQVF